MTAPPEHPSAPDPGVGTADPTRDIRLPMLPGRAAPDLPTGWAAAPATSEEPTAEARASRAPSAFDQRTDEHPAPPEPSRDRTLSFSSPEMRHRPVGPVSVNRSPRRWPWFVVSAVPVLIIVGTGIWLLLLLRAA